MGRKAFCIVLALFLAAGCGSDFSGDGQALSGGTGESETRTGGTGEIPGGNSGSGNVRAVTESEPRSPGGSKGDRSGGTFAKTFTFTVTEYEITREQGFDLVSIPGAETDVTDLLPVLPFFMTTLQLPAGSSVRDIRLLRGETESLGPLDIPTYHLVPSPDPPPSFTDETYVSGLWPDPNYGHSVHNDGYREVVLRFYPVQHDADTGETILWTEAELEVEYEAPEAVFVSSLRTDKGEYETTEDVVATVVLKNVGDRDISDMTATVVVEEPTGEIWKNTEKSAGVIPAGGSGEVVFGIGNGLETGSYTVTFELRDRDGNVADSVWKWIFVVSDRITDMRLVGERTAFDAGEEISFLISAENHNPFPIEGLMMVEIYDGWSRDRELFADGAEIPASSSLTEIVISGDTGRLEPGRYEARGIFVQPGKEDRISPERIPFVIKQENDLDCDFQVGLVDAILALRIQVSASLPPEVCLGDSDGDGKVGVSEAVRILRLISGTK